MRDLSLLNMDLFFLQLAFKMNMGLGSSRNRLLILIINYNLQVAADPGGSSRVEERPQQHSSRRRMNHPHTRRATYRAPPPRVRSRQLGRAALQGAMNFNFPSGMGLDSVFTGYELCFKSHICRVKLTSFFFFSLKM